MSAISGSDRWIRLLVDIYGEGEARAIAPSIRRLLSDHGAVPHVGERWDERDAWFIAYPDQFRADDQPPLAALNGFYAKHLAGAFNGVHALPFFPSTSDEGFSISDYSSVDPQFGSWTDISSIGSDARLMVDAVVNHCSVGSEYFNGWKNGDAAFRDFFRTADLEADVSQTVRAREHPLLTPVRTVRGDELLWTTFSPDQADLNYGNPEVLRFMLANLLEFARRGASVIRLDAACFLWKQEGTTSIHLRETHQIIQFLRACFDATYADVILVSETNVPHAENVSYLGDGVTREADMVYRFTLPPLTLHAFVTGQAGDLRRWLSDVSPTPPDTTYLNFLSSHDGVGLRPLEGIVGEADVERLVAEAERHGGRANRRRNTDGTSSPYELNATWYDLIRGSASQDDALARHLASHAIMLAMSGIPAVYAHGLLASENDVALMDATGSARSINRERLRIEALERTLADPASRAAQSVGRITDMLRWRRSSPAFHPASPQSILDTPDSVVGIERTAAAGDRARVFVNVSDVSVRIDGLRGAEARGFRFNEAGDRYDLAPWGTLWLFDR